MNDEDWHEQVENHLLRDLVEDLQERVKELDNILRGEKGDAGLISEYERHDEIITKLYAVVIQDSTGKKGLLHDIDYLMGRRSDQEKNRQLRWQFWTAIIVAIISSLTMILTNWDKLKGMMPVDHPDAIHQAMERVKHPRKKIYRIHYVPAKPDNEEPSTD